MPVFERQFHEQRKNVDGQAVIIHPAQILQKTGPVLEVSLSPTRQAIQRLMETGHTPPPAVNGLALIDTGASVTAVDETVCRRLGLKPTDITKVSHAGGSEMRACYPIQMTFPETRMLSIVNTRTLSVNLQSGSTPFVLLLGRDLLARMRFVYNGPMGRIELAF